MIEAYIQITEIKKESREFGGFASVKLIDKQGDLVPIAELMKVMGTLMKRGASIIDSHSNYVCGKILAYEERPTPPPDSKPGIWIKAQIYDDYASDDEVWNAITRGEIKGFSIGGRSTKSHKECDETSCYRVLDKFELFEVSVCRVPANPQAVITEVAGKPIETLRKDFLDAVTRAVEDGRLKMDMLSASQLLEKCTRCKEYHSALIATGATSEQAIEKIQGDLNDMAEEKTKITLEEVAKKLDDFGSRLAELEKTGMKKNDDELGEKIVKAVNAKLEEKFAAMQFVSTPAPAVAKSETQTAVAQQAQNTLEELVSEMKKCKNVDEAAALTYKYFPERI